MLYQSRQGRYRKQTNKSLYASSRYQQPQEFQSKNGYASQRMKNNISKTSGSSTFIRDSLQQFQNQLNSAIKTKALKNHLKKRSFLPYVQSRENEEMRQIKAQITNMKNLIQNQQQNAIQQKLQKIVIQLENQKQRLHSQSQRTELEDQRRLRSYTQSTQMQPMMPPIMYQPYPIFQPMMTPYPHSRRRSHRRRKYSDQEQSDQQDKRKQKPEKKPQKSQNSKKIPKTNLSKIKSRLRVFFHAVIFMIRLRKQAKQKAAQRRLRLQKFCKDKFFQKVNNVKQWLLEAHKISLTIILEKSKLNLVYFNDQSQRLRKEKQKLIMKVIYLGLKQLSQTSTQKKVQKISELINNLCLDGCYPIRNLWTRFELGQVSVSEHYGFFKLDESLQKYMITLLIFVKILLFNMFLQPSKFDEKNFQKNVEPLKTNMKIISSVYYCIFKEVLADYHKMKRDSSIYKIGNCDSSQLTKIVPSQPYVYEKGKENASTRKNQYISGLFEWKQLSQIQNLEQWEICIDLVKEIIEKIYKWVDPKKHSNK